MATDDHPETSTAKGASAPHPDDPRKPDNPSDLTKPSWKYVGKKVYREFIDDQCPDLAAALTYFGVLSLFPGILALVSILGLFGDSARTTAALLEIVQGIAPGSALDTIRGPIEDVTASPAAGFTFVTGLAVALWSASGYVGAFARAMNRIYEVDEGRPFLKLRGTMLAVTLLTIIAVALLAGMLVLSGPIAEAVGGAMGVGGQLVTVWNIAKWPVIVVLVVLLIAVLYYATPNVKQPKFRWISMGSVVALLVSVVASAGFGFYVANFGNYNKTYGAIGGVIIMLLWLWIMNMSLLFGGEIDAEIERGRELQAGIKAEETIQLPPKDTKKSEKAQAQEDEETAAGRKLREQHSKEH